MTKRCLVSGCFHTELQSASNSLQVVSGHPTVTMSEWVRYLDWLPEKERSQCLAKEDVEGLTPIHCAARCDALEALQQLIDLGAGQHGTACYCQNCKCSFRNMKEAFLI